jgi:hypothetical protein
MWVKLQIIGRKTFLGTVTVKYFLSLKMLYTYTHIYDIWYDMNYHTLGFLWHELSIVATSTHRENKKVATSVCVERSCMVMDIGFPQWTWTWEVRLL